MKKGRGNKIKTKQLKRRDRTVDWISEGETEKSIGKWRGLRQRGRKGKEKEGQSKKRGK